MTDNSSPPPPGHINSPFFTKLPGEVRWMIYREFFDGSRQEVRRHKDREDPTNRHTEFFRICMPFNRQFSFVRTCKAVYEESLHLYWCMTSVTCAYKSFRTNLNAIPFYARPRIRVLEGVATADNLTPTGQIPLDQFLGHFPNLQYCQLRHDTVHLYCHHDEIPPEDVLAKSGSEAFREIALSLNADKPPILVQRIYVWSKKDRDVSRSYTPFTSCSSDLPSQPQGPGFTVEWQKTEIEIFKRVSWVYVNHTESRLYITASGSISDEEGFKKVTGPVEEGEETQDTDNSNVVPDSINFDETIDVQEANEADDEHYLPETSMTDDATEVNDMDVYEDKLEDLNESEDDNEVS